jgi:glycosyltransferase involved in cell wall biosynthesis
MRVAYVFDRVLPATQSDAQQMMCTLTALARRGVQMTLVVPAGKEPPTAARLREHYHVEGDFEVVAIPTPLTNPSTARKWLHAYAASAHSVVRGADLLYTRNFPMLTLAPRTTRPFVYETYRAWMDMYPPLRPGYRRALHHPAFAAGIFHSAMARERYLALDVPADKLHVVYNGYDPRMYEPRLSPQDARRELELPTDRSLVVYTGHVNATKGMEVVISMARRCPEVTFVLVGAEPGGATRWLMQQQPNVRVVSWQPFDRVVRYLYAADVLLQPPSSVPLRVVGNTVLPMKLFQYLAAGRPILAPKLPDVCEVLDDATAVLVPSGDAATAARELRGLLANPERCQRLGRNALERAKRLTWDARAERIERILAEALERAGTNP